MKKVYFLTLLGTLAILAAVFGISGYYGEEMAVPVISYGIAETSAERRVPANAIDINTAAAQELEALDGIGPATAGKIIEYREKYGGFDSVEELMEVEGIGEGKLAAIKDLICVSPRDTSSAEDTSVPERGLPEYSETERKTENIFPVNINTASEEELMQVNGIGEVIAGRIREYAEETGFKTVDELINIKGIGEKKLEDIRPYVTV